MVTRDKKRSFSITQKNEILYQQDNMCGKCNHKLDPRAIEYHHRKPWAAGGRTITVNGLALCPKCHKIIAHEERLKEQEGTASKQAESNSKLKKASKRSTNKKKLDSVEEYNQSVQKSINRMNQSVQKSIKRMNKNVDEDLDRIFKI